MVKLYEGVEAPEVNSISAGTTIIGDITAASNCRIDGNVKGNIDCKAKVVIGPNGVLEGDIKCECAEIEGKVKANITATDLISLRSTAILAGDIVSSKLSIEPGATFSGNCKIQSNGRPAITPETPEN